MSFRSICPVGGIIKFEYSSGLQPQKRCFSCACISVKRGARFMPKQYRMAKFTLLMLCMSPVIVVGMMSEVLL